jgi:dihydrofolate reductase
VKARKILKMRKLIFQMMVSVDGHFEGPGKELDWHQVDEEFNVYANDLLGKADLLVFGRMTFELMAAYWPGASAIENDPIIAGKMNELPKIVFSRTLKKTGPASPERVWKNSRLMEGGLEEEIMKLKGIPGKDMVIFGSSCLALNLMKSGLIDEYRIIVNPIALGKGKSVFAGLDQRIHLKLRSVRQFKSGNVLLHYSPG